MRFSPPRALAREKCRPLCVWPPSSPSRPGHSFIEQELAQIGFRKNDNAFLADDDVAALCKPPPID
jgi:hypothetical protein